MVMGGGGVREEVDFFNFSLVPNVFPLRPLSSQWYPLGSQNVPNVFSNMFSIAPHFYPIRFSKCCPPFTYLSGPKGRNSILQNRTLYFGEPP
jgi:hypothetical protein